VSHETINNLAIAFFFVLFAGLLLTHYYRDQMAALIERVLIGLAYLLGIAVVLGICWGLIALVHLAWRHS
jgi:hypothetical protein